MSQNKLSWEQLVGGIPLQLANKFLINSIIFIFFFFYLFTNNH